MMATQKRKVNPAQRNSGSPRRAARVEADHRADAPGGREQPGTGQAGDDIVAPAETEAVQELVEEAKARKGEPRRPLGQVLSPAGTAPDAREAEERIDHAGLANDAADEERASSPPPCALES